METNPYCTKLPVFDLSLYLDSAEKNNGTGMDVPSSCETGSEGFVAAQNGADHRQPNCISAEQNVLCQRMAETLRDTSTLVIRDPRVCSGKNERFLSLMEAYFERPLEEKLKDARPELAYQVGITPEGVERPRCLKDEDMQETMNSYREENRPKKPCGPDPKWRYFWRLGERPRETRFKELNADPVIPKGFPEWKDVMNDWGYHMLHAVETVAEMVAIGFGLEKDTFTQRMYKGPHLLAPTGVSLEKWGVIDTVFAGYHNDLNFLTIHGKSRFPGLYIWLRDGTKLPVRIPDGCLLLQAGKQLEWLTGGYVMAGFHEVCGDMKCV